ncbi:MAG: class I SAM-dependent methyltransferase [Leptolyngbyaceae cyanobacterium bins.302]|nr:class I SAM-dependent methyltransferase [Leptolyngbyaceae cyanobacterium bins.302]
MVNLDPGIETVELDNNGNHKALGDLITCHITESLCARITFADYMDLALYHPQYGYYASAPTKIGASGDFFTSPHLGSDFGELLAKQFVQMGQLLQPIDRFTVIEMGAGQGLLARDILTDLQAHHPEFVTQLDYIIVERSPALIAEQRQCLQPLLDQGIRISWRTLEALASDSITGCIFSNELIDALPVHQVVVREGQLQEIYVTMPEGDRTESLFTETTADLSTPRLAEYFNIVGIDLTSPRYPDGYRTEVNLAALDWISHVASKLQRGYVVTIDYGYSSDRYYNPMRSTGTLQCYYRHRYHSNPYIYIGQQDITAHVDFTALQKHGEQCGLHTVGFTKQGLFLMSLGLGDRMAAISQSQVTDLTSMNEVLRRRDALQTLINPVGLGNFGVLIQSKGVERNETLDGLRGEQI